MYSKTFKNDFNCTFLFFQNWTNSQKKEWKRRILVYIHNDNACFQNQNFWNVSVLRIHKKYWHFIKNCVNFYSSLSLKVLSCTGKSQRLRPIIFFAIHHISYLAFLAEGAILLLLQNPFHFFCQLCKEWQLPLQLQAKLGSWWLKIVN